VVGWVSNGGFSRSLFIWREGVGAQLFSDYLRGAGIEVPTNLALGSITGMSADGRTFAGTCGNAATNEVLGYVVTIPAPSSLVLLALSGGIATRRRR
jgi:hypothetical protein